MKGKATPAARRRSGKLPLREKVARELAEFERRKVFPSAFLNNFHSRLPGGFLRNTDFREVWDQTYDDPRASRKRRQMTLAQFFALVDRLIPEVGLDPETIIKLQNAHTGEIYDYVFPLYLRLREEGFKHYPDLTA